MLLIMGKIIQYNFMVGELLLLLKGHSRSHVTCKALYPFQTKHIVTVVRFKIAYKVTVTLISQHTYVTFTNSNTKKNKS